MVYMSGLKLFYYAANIYSKIVIDDEILLKISKGRYLVSYAHKRFMVSK